MPYNLPPLPIDELEEMAGHMCPQARLRLARKFEKWAFELRVSADVFTKPKRARVTLRHLTKARLVRN